GGGGGGGGGTGGTGRVYVANGTTGSIAGFTIANGTLTAVPNSPLSLGFQPLAAVVSPNNSFLYVAGAGSVNVYAINSDGSLSAVNLGVAISVTTLDISPDGQWLFGLDLLANNLDQFQIDPSSGGLATMTPTAYPSSTGTLPTPQMVKVSPAGNLIFASLGTGGDAVFTLDTASGTVVFSQQLTLSSASTSDNGIAVAVNSAGTYLYIARSGTNGGIAVYTVGSGGTLNQIAGSPFVAGNQPFAVSLDTTGKYLYVANRQDGTISGYTIGTNSALTAIAGSPFGSGTQVNSLGAERSGTYLLAGAQGGNPDLSMYSFDTTTAGKLDLAKSTATDTDPAGVTAIALTH
ncbi:MAG TPA: beta-propeller fold lactonase family protein, partial [Edaphobacter sp.]|nr:beta-propeller fold lactonase family protein [Edaphobacter sp.]